MESVSASYSQEEGPALIDSLQFILPTIFHDALEEYERVTQRRLELEDRCITATLDVTMQRVEAEAAAVATAAPTHSKRRTRGGPANRKDVAGRKTSEDMGSTAEAARLRKKLELWTRLGRGPLQAWGSAMDDLQDQEEQFHTHCDPHLAWARERRVFLGSRAPNNFVIEELLGEDLTQCAPPPSEPCEYILDPLSIARGYMTHLTDVYGYRPLRGLKDVGKVLPEEHLTSPELEQRLDEQAAGGMMPCCQPWLLDHVMQDNAAFTAERQAEAHRHSRNRSPSPDAMANGKPDQLAAPVAAFPRGDTTRRPFLISKHLDSPPAVVPRDRLKQLAPVECSVKANGGVLELRCAPQATHAVVVKYWNRDAYRLRLKPGDSPSAWVTLKPLTPGYSPDKSINPGMCIEFEVTFAPVDTSSPTSTHTLLMGFVREVNERTAMIDVKDSKKSTNAQSAVWGECAITLHCVTVLPKVHLMPKVASEVEEMRNEEVVEAFPTFSDETGTGPSSLFLPSAGLEGGIGSLSPIQNDMSPQTLFTSLLADQARGPTIAFQPTVLLTERSLDWIVTNTGSRAFVEIEAKTPFSVEPSAFVIKAKGTVGVRLTFCPHGDNEVHDFVRAVVREREGDAPILQEVTHAITGRGIIPTVRVMAIGGVAVEDEEDMAIHGDTKEPWVPFYSLPDTTVGQGSLTEVRIYNPHNVDLPFEWRTSHAGAACEFQVKPMSGILRANSSTTSVVQLKPLADEPIASLLMLFLKGMPHNAEPQGSGTVPFYSRRKTLPTLIPTVPRQAPHDPFDVFRLRPPAAVDTHVHNNSCVNHTQQPSCVAEGTADDVYACGLRIMADPVKASLVLHPNLLQDTIPVLTKTINTRTFVLTNLSSRPLTFWLDPPRGEGHPEVVLRGVKSKEHLKIEKRMKEIHGSDWKPSTQFERPDCKLTFQPLRGSIAPHGNVSVTCHMSFHALGAHNVDVECYVPEIGSAESPWLKILAHCVGPTIHMSHRLLEFGLIQYGREAEAHMMLSNNNPIPVDFQVLDPECPLPEVCPQKEAEACATRDRRQRFVFLPDGGTLRPQQSMDITVYRQGHTDWDDGHCFFEIHIDGGDVLTVETRATIQQPSITVWPTSVDFGIAPRDVYQEGEVCLTNHFALDIPFEVVVLSMPESVTIYKPPAGVLMAGEREHKISIRAKFCGSHPEVAVLAIVVPDIAPLLFEVLCQEVEQLSVALSLSVPDFVACTGASGDGVSERNSTTHLTAAAGSRGGMMGRKQRRLPAARMTAFSTVETFIQELLWNLIAQKVCLSNEPSSEDSLEPTLTASAGPEPPTILFSHCPTLRIPNCHISDTAPFCAVEANLLLENMGGCGSRFEVRAQWFPLRDADAFQGTLDTAAPASQNATSFPLSWENGTGTMRSGVPNRNKAHRGFPLEGTQSLGQSQFLGSTAGRTMIPPAETVLPPLRSDQPRFQCKRFNGREAEEQLQGMLLNAAQQMLVDGRGFATRLRNAEGPLVPFGSQQVTVTFVSNIPGIYTEVLHVQCEGIPSVKLPVHAVIHGKPILIDPDSAGLSVQKDHVSLLLPSAIAGMGVSRRSMRLTSRFPRDLDVTITLHPPNDRFRVVMCEPSEGHTSGVTGGTYSGSERENSAAHPMADNAERVTFKLVEVKEESLACTTVSPSAFCLEALGSREVFIEYRPPPASPDLFRAAIDVIDWSAMVHVKAVPATTSFNDEFMIDEFYALHADRYPAERTLAKRRLGKASASVHLAVPTVTKLAVMAPRITRPSTITASIIQEATPTERLALETGLRRLLRNAARSARSERSCMEQSTHSLLPATANGSEGARLPSPAPMRMVSRLAATTTVGMADFSSESENEAKAERSKAARDREAAVSACQKSLEQLRSEEQERDELRRFLIQRRAELQKSAGDLFDPLLIRIHAQIALPRLTAEPSNIQLPLSKNGETCARTLLLTNNTSAPLEFQLRMTEPTFFLSHVRYAPAAIMEDPLLEEGQPDWAPTAASKPKTKKKLTSKGPLPTLAAQPPTLTVAMPRRSTTLLQDPTALAHTRFYLGPHDALEATVALHTGRNSLDNGASPEDLEGYLVIQFAEDAATEQRLHVHAPVNIPSVVAEPDAVWFRPCVMAKDGRPQPSYAQTVRLRNYSNRAAPFHIEHAPAAQYKSHGEVLNRLRKVKNVICPTPLEEMALVLDDPTHFRLDPMQGVVPAASAGGVPGVLSVKMWFLEHSNVRFESQFKVVVNDGLGTQFFVRGDSRETEV